MKRVALWVVVLFCLRSDGVYQKYTGIDQADVDAFLSPLTCQYISEDQWMAGIQAQQNALQASNAAVISSKQNYITELTTTTQAVVDLGNGYVGASAITQVNYNAKVVRIIQLRKLLGLQ